MAVASSSTDRQSGVPVTVSRYAPPSGGGTPLAPRGSIVVYLAASGSPELARLREQAGLGGSGLLTRLLRLFRRGGGGTETIDLTSMDRADAKDSVPVSLAYAGTLLADAVPVPRDGRVVRVILPYTGAGLREDALVLRGENAGKVSTLALRNDPPLSRVERAALELVPEAMLGLHVGAALPGKLVGVNDEERRRQEEAAREARMEQAMARAEAMAEAAADRAERQAEKGREFAVHLRDEVVAGLPPAATAAALLQIRRDSLAGPGM
jgi:hypothetical protein